MRSAALLVAVAVALPFAALPFAGADHGAPHSERTTPEVVSSVDGVRIPLTVYRPLAASAENPVPVILHGHGWAGSRTNGDGAFADFVARGYGIASIDMRGHGEAKSLSQARVHSPDFEIRDVRDVISYLATLDWVLLDAAGDPRLGAIGGSYGGGYQLLTAALDPRLDAIVPETTWNSLATSLGPNGAIKSDWVHLLYWGAKATGTTLHPVIDAAYQDAMVSNRWPDGTTLPNGADVVSWFEASSPASYPDAITIPTLLVQGVPDTLFNLNQAVRNLEQIRGQAPVWLVAHNSGHILNACGTLNRVPGFDLCGAGLAVGLQPPGGGSPCADVGVLRLDFFDAHLRGLGSFERPAVSLPLEDGSCLTFDAWPPVEEATTVAAPGPVAVPAGTGPARVLVPLLLPAYADRTLAGIPTVSALPAVGLDAILYFSLVALGADGPRVLDAQVAPYRFAPTGPTDALEPVAFELGGIVEVLREGEALFLSVESWNEQYATNANRVPDGAALLDLEVGLPLL